MTSDRLRLRLSGDERRRRESVESLTAASQEAVVGRVLNKRVFEAIGRLRRGPVDEEKVRIDETAQGGFERGFVEPAGGWLGATRDLAQERIREAPPQDRADLRDLARRPKTVEPRRQRLPERRRNRLRRPLLAALENEPRHLLDEQAALRPRDR